ncbi:hypothetical protein JD78_03840 [Modestobacter roseus]|uniref:DUF192 domain-containing protein n=2 Tax=Modestobacter roseus TaxID=1181884 RepID=A0A562IXG7_9ACTN|nr:hypothetical protein [Modestobacter roseus]TWH75285.1 hypothetical protein JD78_03840 [Modestobacter roseus]
MLFRSAEHREVTFWMADTLVPLDIAWLDGDTVLGVTRMTPCLSDQAQQCPRYPSPGPVDAALEVPGGALAELTVGAAVTRG